MAKVFENIFWVLFLGTWGWKEEPDPTSTVSLYSTRVKKCFCRLPAQLQAQWDPVVRGQSDRARYPIYYFVHFVSTTNHTSNTQTMPPNAHSSTHTFFFHEKWAYTQNAYNQPNKTNKTIPIFTKPFSLTTIKHDWKTRHLCRGLRDGWAVKNTYCSIMKTRISIPWHIKHVTMSAMHLQSILASMGICRHMLTCSHTNTKCFLKMFMWNGKLQISIHQWIQHNLQWEASTLFDTKRPHSLN